jgi:hypothetical protein
VLNAVIAFDLPTSLNPKMLPNVSFLLNKKLTFALVLITILGPPLPFKSILVSLVI